MSVRPEDYDEVVGRINRKYENDIRRGNELKSPLRIPTGSLELDAAMGGGIPIGRWSRFFGGYHSTKTLTALNVIREAQEMGLMCAYYNIEQAYDEGFAGDKIGINVDQLTVVDGTSIEEVGDKMEALLGVVHLHVVDSCTMAVSEDELDADIRDWRPGISSRAWGKVFKRLNDRFDHRENTIIMIDQVRTNFKSGGEEAAGGRIMDHQSSMSVHFKKGSWLDRNPEGYLDEKAKQQKGMSGQIEPSGMEVKARVVKSRVGRPFRTATMRLDLDSLKFDRDFEYIKAAKFLEIVERRGSYYYYQGNQIGQGEKPLREFVMSDLTLKDEIREGVMAMSRR